MSTGGPGKRKLEEKTGKQSWFHFSPPKEGFKKAIENAKRLTLLIGSSNAATWPEEVHLLHCLFLEEGDICTCMEPQPVAPIFQLKKKYRPEEFLSASSGAGSSSGPSSSGAGGGSGSGSGSGSGPPAVSVPCCPPLAPPQRAPLLHALCALCGGPCCSALTLCPSAASPLPSRACSFPSGSAAGAPHLPPFS